VREKVKVRRPKIDILPLSYAANINFIRQGRGAQTFRSDASTFTRSCCNNVATRAGSFMVPLGPKA